MPAYAVTSSAAITIGKKASQLSSRIAIAATTVTTVTTNGTQKSRRTISIGRSTAACQASAVSCEERAPASHAVSGRSRLITLTSTKPIPIAVSPRVTARIVRKSPLETE